jgi:AhpD family alkylhydroperoxidase
MSELNSREKSLVALGAAIASNCVPCVEYHVPGAKKVGLSDGQIKEALRIADKVRQHPARAVLEAALARIEEGPNGSADTAGSGCGCTESNPATGISGVS